MRGGPRVPEDKADKLRRFFRHSYIRIWSVTRAIAESAQDYVWKHGIRPKDAIRLLAWVDMYCQAHPLDDIAKAAEKLVAALFDQAKASRK